jgi:CHAT domain-containing protein
VIARLSLPSRVRRCLVSPDESVCSAPFSLLAPELEVAYEPSATTYGILLDQPAERGRGVLALGDPDYDADAPASPTAGKDDPRAAPSRAERGRGAKLVRLPNPRAEALAVGDTTLLGRDATEAGLRGAIARQNGRFRAIHCACHGLVDPDHPMRSALALTRAGSDDGDLTAAELVGMTTPCDLAVLSACETAQGRILRGEGIFGLTRAFMFAGSPRVLCSLWKVDDAATRALMEKFYELWNPKDGRPGLPTATALKQAQEFVRSQERWEHPYFWAAWVLWGLPS